MKRIATIVAALALTSAAAQAAEPDSSKALWLNATTVSWHPDRAYARAQNLTDVTPGIGLELHLREDVRVLATVLRNSYRNESVAVAVAWQPVKLFGVRVGVAGGVINGYPYNDERFGPMAAAVASVEGARWGANLVAVPTVRERSRAAVTLQVKWRLS
jgi:hypothetical protein